MGNSKRNIVVTGAAGFVGSHMVDFLLSKNHNVLGIDNLSTGQEAFLEKASHNKNFSLEQIDLLQREKLSRVFRLFGATEVYHFAANADIRFGLQHPKKDLENGTIATFNVLESCRDSGCQKIVFSSTGAVYGEAKQIPTPEDCIFPKQTSLYGASKIAAESLIQAYCEGYRMSGFIYRFVALLGDRYQHGHVLDFLNKLSKNPKKIEILGNGLQKKSYLHIEDCIQAISMLTKWSPGKSEVYNLGQDHYITVNESLDVITKQLNLNPERIYSGGNSGWIGDNPFIFLDCTKARNKGWKPNWSIKDSIIDTVNFLTNKSTSSFVDKNSQKKVG